MEFPPGKTLLLFDGYCHLCNGAVSFILRFDNKRKFLFSPLSSEIGVYWRKKFDISDQLDSIIIIDKGKYYSKAEAVLFIAKKLGGIFHLVQVLYGLPQKYRVRFYDWVASKRYRWFGRYDSCMIPKPEYKDRFI